MNSLVSDTAMVMAAGMGSRMRPLTDTQPKPMIEVAGKPLIDHALDRLADAGVSTAIVNVHYLPDMLEAHVQTRQSPHIIISDERDMLLETGGAMIKAQPHLPDPFFCLNSDNIWIDGVDNAFATLSQAWDGERMDALLLLVPHSRAPNSIGLGDFHTDSEGQLSRRDGDNKAPYIYTGIQIVSHRLLRDSNEEKFSTNILWSRAIEEGRLYGIVFDGELLEVGTPESIAPTEIALAAASEAASRDTDKSG